ncbi:MAG: glutamate--cysteine ligase [Myxococcales bacterium]|nr:glutamate--cysteine ligase [Myxococcales bacterium]
MQPGPSLHLFEAIGIELEYMIVDAETLDVRPIADALLTREAGAPVLSLDRGPIAWSNELALHVIELKTNGPTVDLDRAALDFQANVRAASAHLSPLAARLLPTGMHPWMDPHRELRLWPHDDDVIYATFHRIFDCRGHGWANLQSMHVNLPFQGDDEFGRLHAAVRLVLPLLPALAASSPLADGHFSGAADTRLVHYATNARRVPSVSGKIIPEPVFTHDAYQGLLRGIYRDLEPHDPDEILREEWVNARGAIARFDRDAIEIRVLDTQECPRADLTIAALVVDVVERLTARATGESSLYAWSEDRLARVLASCIQAGDEAVIDDLEYVELLIGPVDAPLTARDVWRRLADGSRRSWTAAEGRCLDHLLHEGCLAHRIRRRLGPQPRRAELQDVYRDLADCLVEGRLFSAPPRA